MFRQGDILIFKAPEGTDLDSINNLKPVDRDNGRVVLAYGEVTGHAHAIVDRNAQLFQTDTELGSDRYLRVVEDKGGNGVTLRHEEHGPIPLGPGLYIVRRQREYTPEEIRTVAD